MNWEHAQHGFDEAFDTDGTPRPHYARVIDLLKDLGPDELKRREQMQQVSLMNQGITFTVYGDEEGLERIFPFDFVPRIITSNEWKIAEEGLIQRLEAINLFLEDVYGARHCLEDKMVPHNLIHRIPEYRREVIGVRPRHGIFTHVVGTDLLRDDKGDFLVLEDNCRSPSGVSYVLENRALQARIFPELVAGQAIRGVDSYPQLLLDSLRHSAPMGRSEPSIAVLTPGVHNSAYFEHSFLAREMGVPLVEGRDLVVDDDQVYVRTIDGRQRIDVLYRRIDDEFIDPVVFDRNSMLGVPGLIHAYRTGNITIANAPGAGVADNKAIYPCVPDLIRYYLDQDAILPQIPTYRGWMPDEQKFIRENLANLVVKLAGGAGGYGMLVGPTASAAEVEEFRGAFNENPESYVAQNLVEFSSHPTHIGDGFEPRRVDLRPYALVGESIKVLPGGLTRVALVKGSYVVNSSQGGGSKDTWILADSGERVDP